MSIMLSFQNDIDIDSDIHMSQYIVADIADAIALDCDFKTGHFVISYVDNIPEFNPDFPYFSPNIKYYRKAKMNKDFIDIRFESNVFHIDSNVSIMFNNVILKLEGGQEQRQKRWEYAKKKFNLGNRTYSFTEYKALERFFNNVQGDLTGFRYRDYTDYSSEGQQPLNDGLTKPNVKEYRTFKVYGLLDNTYTRRIYKPVFTGLNETFKLYLNDTEVPFSTSGNTSLFTVLFNEGKVVYNPPVYPLLSHEPFMANNLKTKITFTLPRNLTTLDWINFNGSIVKIDQVISPTEYVINLDTRDLMIIIESVELRLRENDEITWSGEFDVPVRFNTGTLEGTISHGQYGENGTSENVTEVFVDVGDLPLEELKLKNLD